MGLFQKKILPIVTPKYQLGHQETLLIVGLGNIGKQYEKTRHNAGFICVDDFTKREEFNPWIEKSDLKSTLCAKIIDGKKVILCRIFVVQNRLCPFALAVLGLCRRVYARMCFLCDLVWI